MVTCINTHFILVTSLVFTAGATASLKLLGESLPWAGAELRLHEDCHTSALGIREMAQTR